MSIIDPIKLKNMTAGDDDLVADLAIMFVRKLPELKAQMRIGIETGDADAVESGACLLYTSPSPRDRQKSRMPSSA